MYRKIIATLLILVLAVTSTACRKGKDAEKEKRKPSGYRKYEYEYDSSEDSELNARKLTEEFEDLVSESTYIEYDSDGNPLMIIRKYYDDTGEHLLKEVTWKSSESTPTESCEYDGQGRLIRYSQKYEGQSTYDNYLEIPEMIFSFQKKGSINPMISFASWYLNADELTTEYTYKGNSDRLATMRTVDGDGTTVCYLECGEGDIVISEKIAGRFYSYEETYDPGERKSVWKFTAENGYWETVVGEREFDDSGRCIRSRKYTKCIDPQNLDTDTVITYSEEGAVEVTTNYLNTDSDRVIDSRETIWYDVNDNPLRIEKEESSWGESDLYLRSISTFAYHANGETAFQGVSYANSDTREMHKSYEKEFDEKGNNIVLRDYIDGDLYREIKTSFIEVPDVSGTVRYSVWLYYGDYGAVTYDCKTYELCMLGGTEETWVYYNWEETDEDGKFTTDKYTSYFESGHLKKTVTGGEYYSRTMEFDDRGRLVRYDTSWKEEGAWGIIYEYWEGEKPESTS